VHAAAQHPVEEAPERRAVLRLRVGVVVHLALTEEDAEHRTGPLDPVGDSGAGELGGDSLGDGVRHLVEPLVDLGGA